MKDIKLSSYSKLLRNKEIRNFITEKVGNYKIETIEPNELIERTIIRFEGYPQYTIEACDYEVLFTEGRYESVIQTRFTDVPIVNTIALFRYAGGCVFKRIEEVYKRNPLNMKDRTITDITEKSYVFTNLSLKKQFTNNSSIISYEELFKILCDFSSNYHPLEIYADDYTLFSIHTKFLPNVEPLVSVFVKDQDVSGIYKGVYGKNQVRRIYELYNGNINDNILFDLDGINYGVLSPKAYDLKTLMGVNKRIEDLIGPSFYEPDPSYYEYISDVLKQRYGYFGHIDFFDRDSLIEGIMYKEIENDNEMKQNKPRR